MRFKALILALCVLSVGWTFEGGWDPGQIPANRIETDVTNFNGYLSSADTDVQKALDTLDGLTAYTDADAQDATGWTDSGTNVRLTTLTDDVTIGPASTTYFSANADLGVKGNIETDGIVYVGTGAPSHSQISSGGDAYFTGDVEIDQALYVDGFIYGNGSKLTGMPSSLSGLHTNAVPVANSSSTLIDSAIYSVAGNVGIGTSSPSTKFQVAYTVPGADLTDGKTVIYGTSITGNPSYLIDNNSSSVPSYVATVPNTSYVGIDFGIGITKDITNVTCQWNVGGDSNYALQGISIQSSDNGSSWSAGQAFSPAKTIDVQQFIVTSQGAHRYWRILATAYNYGGAGYGYGASEVEMAEDFIYLTSLSATSTGNVGVKTTAPDKALEINSDTGANLRLTYNDSDGSASNYADFSMSSSGDLTIIPSGGNVAVNGAVDITGTAGAGYLTLVGQSSNPTSPAAGTLLLHSSTANGFTRMEQDNEGGTNLVYARDSVLICKNDSGGQITKGNVVYIKGTASGVPTVAKARANSLTTMPALGFMMDTTADGSFGQVMKIGILSGIDTSVFSEGVTLYVSTATAGEWQTTRPSGTTNYVQRLGTVLSQNATTGTIAVTVAPFVGNMETGTNASTWTGSEVVATTFVGDLTGTSSSSTTTNSDNAWTGHNNYPAGCAAGNYVQVIGDTLTCSPDLTGGGGSISGLTPGKLTYANSATTIADSIVSQSGTLLTVAGSMSVSGQATFPQVNATTFVGALTGHASSDLPVANPTYIGLMQGGSMTLSGQGTFSTINATIVNQNSVKVVSTATAPLYVTTGNATIDLTAYATTSSLSGYVPTSRTVNSKSLTGNIVLGQMDIDLSLYAKLLSPSFTTPTLGVATATSVNKVTITAPATSATLTIADGKTLTATNTVNLNTMTDGKFCTYTASGTVINCTSDAGSLSMPLSYLTVSGQSTLSGDVTIGSASTTYFSAQPDLGVKGALEVDGGIYAMSTLSALGTGNVGIGTTNPTQKLSVTGSVTISADLYCGTAKATTGYRNLCIDSTGKIFSVSSASTCGAGT